MMGRKVRLGIIGLSKGNGHPYSWSAICNGYDPEAMASCPFPVIPEYLSKHRFPEEFIQEARVTHIWTQDRSVSQEIAKASKIEKIVDNYTDLIGKVDGILLARDDSETHYELSAPFIQAGLPIYIDKPIATTVEEAERIYSLERYENQIFTCSALRFAKEFCVSREELRQLGEIESVEAAIRGKWETYGVHIIEPVLNLIDHTGQIVAVDVIAGKDSRVVTVTWESGLCTKFQTDLDFNGRPSVFINGKREALKLVYNDTFNAFKAALQEFVDIIRGKKDSVPKPFVLKVVEIVEAGAEP